MNLHYNIEGQSFPKIRYFKEQNFMQSSSKIRYFREQIFMPFVGEWKHSEVWIMSFEKLNCTFIWLKYLIKSII